MVVLSGIPVIFFTEPRNINWTIQYNVYIGW